MEILDQSSFSLIENMWTTCILLHVYVYPDTCRQWCLANMPCIKRYLLPAFPFMYKRLVFCSFFYNQSLRLTYIEHCHSKKLKKISVRSVFYLTKYLTACVIYGHSNMWTITGNTSKKSLSSKRWTCTSILTNIFNNMFWYLACC